MLENFMIKFFVKPSIESVLKNELYSAERNLLMAQTQLEFAQASVTAYTAQVRRLKKMQVRRLKKIQEELASSCKEQG
jgi:hypothetical protein